jgi:PAS domain S-box-containing protein
MNRHTTVRLRFWLPLFLFGSFTLALTCFTLHGARIFQDNLEKTSIAGLKERLGRIGSRIRFSLQNDSEMETRTDVAMLATTPEVLSTALLDTEGRVISGSRMEWTGRPALAVIPAFEPERFSSVRKSRAPDLHLSADRKRILAYQPILHSVQTGAIRQSRVKVLFVDYDISGIKAGKFRNHILQGIDAWVLALAFMLGMYVALRRWFTKPLQHLEDTAKRLGGGDYSARSDVGGRGELADFSRVFNRMADEVQVRGGRLQAVLDAATESLVVATDRNGRVTLFNTGAERMLGYTAEEVVGKETPMLWHLESEVTERIAAQPGGAGRTPEGIDLFARLVRQDGNAPEVWTFVRKDGKRRTGSLVVTKIFREDGEIVGYLGMAQDITERKAVEDQLRQAQKMEGIGHLAGGIAHDFNNLLTGINGYSEMVLRKIAPDAPYRKEITEIRMAGERAAELTHQLLAFSRKQILQPKVVDLNTVIAGIEEMLSRLIGERIQVVIAPGEDLWKVKADPGQIEQVLINLAVNARDAMPGGGRITIGTSNVELSDSDRKDFPELIPGRHVLLSVADTGIGMDTETQARAFDPFFTTKEQGKGTGLGLSSVHGIVLQSGGHVKIDSKPGSGTGFRIYLPGTVERSPESGSPSVTDFSPKTNGRETLLLAEDDPMVREVTKTFLQARGYTVLAAEDGEDALLVSRSHEGPIVLLLSDVVMPGMSGPELAERIRETRPGIKVLFVSGYPKDEVTGRKNPRQGETFLQKPFRLEDLAQKVREVMDRPPL